MNDDSVSRRRSVVTIGTYDGVHLGHRYLIKQARTTGEAHQLPVVVVTFDRHPLSVVRPEAAPLLLSSLDQKLELLRSTGVDEIIVLHFDAHRARESAEDFVTSMLVGELGAAFIYVGATFRFGHGHRGDFSLLRTMGEGLGFGVTSIDLLTDGAHAVVSSTRIRGLVREGALEEAARLLGRAHEVRGVLVELSGDEHGALGVIVDPGMCLPPAGTYWATVGTLGAVGEKLAVRVIVNESDVSMSAEIVLGTREAPLDEAFRVLTSTGTRFAVTFLSSPLPIG